MKEKSREYLIIALGNIMVLVLLIWFFGGMGRKDYSVNQKEQSRLIGASYMTMNNEFYQIISEEIKARIEAEGHRWVLRDPALDAGRQKEQIEEMLDMGIDVLVLTPVDWKGLKNVLEKARNQGVRIVVVDSDIAEEELADCTITSDNYQAGVGMGTYFISQCPGARVILMTHDTAKSGRDRIQGFVDVVSQKPDITIVERVECDGQLEIAMPRLQELIEDGVQFDQVFCLNDLASVGVVAALEEKEMLNQVGVYGIDASPDSKALIKEHMMQATMAQFPSKIGEEAANVIYRLLNDEQVEKKIRIPVELVTAGNVDEYGIERWQ